MVRNESACERNWMKFSLAYGIEFYCEQNRTNKRLIIRNISLRRLMCKYFCENHFAMSSIYVGHFKPQIQTSKGKFQRTKTGFERCVMQITIAIKVPYRQLGCTRSFDLRGKW
ncbi:hypothetical protein T05_1988 [Trichinella murrelli]|uniref:Uncharacterized protein n=1 Tax=Trichinella murrelli TaxID=144512 RepID=A0A0V0UA70_9BILA|nr:hypothetical protein T05_1988 [Trichinella murrelli]